MNRMSARGSRHCASENETGAPDDLSKAHTWRCGWDPARSKQRH